MERILLEEMTWPEVAAALADGWRTVIVPAGSIEQHGHHLALCTDTVLGTRAAELLAGRLGKALVAPAIRPGLSAHHMAMPGTLTLRPETFRLLVEDYIHCYARHGFKVQILLGSHGGNLAALEEIAQAMDQEYEDVHVLTAPEVPDLFELAKTEQIFGLDPGTNGGHADDRETSEMLALAPGLVRQDRLQKGYAKPLTEEKRALFFAKGVTALTEVGVVGDPAKASASKGRRYFELTADRLAALVKDKLAQAGWEA